MNKKKSIILIMYILVASLFFGCGDKPQADLPTNSDKSIVGSSNYIINGATTFETVADAKGIVMKATTAGGVESVAGFAIEKNDVRQLATAAGGYVTTGELRAIIELIKAENYVNDDFSTINEQVFTKYSEFSVGDYKFSTPQATTALDLSNNMLNTLASTTLTLPAGSGVSATQFRMFVTVTDFNNNYYYTLSISPATDIFVENLSLMKSLSSGTNYTGLNERLVSTTDSFSGLASNGNQADFLFMIDDSGSMHDQQVALTVAANDFETSINLAGMNYNIAILTTSDGADGVPCTKDCYDRSVKSVGIIDNNITVFKLQVDDLNTSGSGSETGIYNSEQALQSISNGDSVDGLLPPLGFPRDNTQLSVVILSDEASHYTFRTASGFNVKDNLFVRDNILVNSIVDTGFCGENSFYADAGEGIDTNGQYDDLANETGGLVGNICNGGDTPDFSAVMQNIVLQAAGAYKLTNRYVKPNSLKVTVDGVESTPSIKNGYMYIEGTNSIAFFGTLPVEGAKIEVYYEYPKDINLFEND